MRLRFTFFAIGFLAPALLEPGCAQEGGLKPNEPSPLLITDTYLPALADARNPTILSNVSTRFLWTWTFIEEHHHHNMAADIKNFTGPDWEKVKPLPDDAKWLVGPEASVTHYEVIDDK